MKFDHVLSWLTSSSPVIRVDEEDRDEESPAGHRTSQHSDGDTQYAETVTGTQLEANALDASLAVESIPELDLHAQKLLQLLLFNPSDITAVRTELMRPDSNLSNRLHNYGQRFHACKAAFGSTEYIQTNVIHQVVQTDAYDPVLYKANAAVLTTLLYTEQWGSGKTAEDLKSLNKEFPQLLGRNFTEESFALALDIRTLALVACLIANIDSEQFDPELFVAEFFLEDDGTENPPFRRWDGVEEYPGWKRDTRKRYKEVLSYVLAGDPFDPERLTEMYSWNEFMERMVAYVRGIYQDPAQQRAIKAAVKAAENFDVTAFASQQTEHESDQSESPPEERSMKSTERSTRPTERHSEPSVRPAKPRERHSEPTERLTKLTERPIAIAKKPTAKTKDGKRRISSKFSGKQLQELHELAKEADAAAAAADAAGLISSSPPRTAQHYFVKFKEIERENNKENRSGEPVPKPRFLDPQPNAERINFESDIDGTPARHNPIDVEKGRATKRARPLSNDGNDDDDEDFSLDTRDENPDRRKRSRMNAPAPRTSGVSKTSAVSNRTSAVSNRTSGMSAQTSITLKRASGDSNRISIMSNREAQEQFEAQEHSHDESASEEIEEPKTYAGRIQKTDKEVRASRPQKVGGRAGRQAWSEEATDALIKLVGKYGSNWKAIENVRHYRLKGRSNVNLKDKARNVKLQCLRSGQRLPPGFAHVTLSEKDRDWLREECNVDVAEVEANTPDVGEQYSDDETASESESEAVLEPLEEDDDEGLTVEDE